MKALILAAGMGERLKHLTNGCPKALVPINGRSLIDYVLDFLDHPAIEEVGIVGGYEFEKLRSYISTCRRPLPFPPLNKGRVRVGSRLQVFHNPHYTEGSVRTIMTALDFLDTDFLLMNADHIYSGKMIDSFVLKREEITAMCDFDRELGPDDMKVALFFHREESRPPLADDGVYPACPPTFLWREQRRRVPHNDKALLKISKALKDFDGGYIGATYVPKSSLGTYKEAANETYNIYGPASPVEFIIGHMAANGHKIKVADLSGIGWLEVDTPEDIARAEHALAKNPKFEILNPKQIQMTKIQMFKTLV